MCCLHYNVLVSTACLLFALQCYNIYYMCSNERLFTKHRHKFLTRHFKLRVGVFKGLKQALEKDDYERLLEVSEVSAERSFEAVRKSTEESFSV